MRRRLLLGSVAALFILPGAPSFSAAPQSDLLSEIEKQISGPQAFSARFRQIKTFTDRALTLEAKGTCSVRKGKFVLWEQKEPFVQTIRLADGKMEISVEGIPQTPQESSKSSPDAFGALITSLLEGRVSELKSEFKASAAGSLSKGWTVVLTPKASSLVSKVFEKIELSGGEAIRKVLLEEKGGGKTLITFSDTQISGHDVRPETK